MQREWAPELQWIAARVPSWRWLGHSVHPRLSAGAKGPKVAGVSWGPQDRPGGGGGLPPLRRDRLSGRPTLAWGNLGTIGADRTWRPMVGMRSYNCISLLKIPIWKPSTWSWLRICMGGLPHPMASKGGSGQIAHPCVWPPHPLRARRADGRAKVDWDRGPAMGAMGPALAVGRPSDARGRRGCKGAQSRALMASWPRTN
jgi:hypothetical protein